MKTLHSSSDAIGVYVTDSKELYNTATFRVHVEERHRGYIPLFDLFTLNHTAELRFTDTVDKAKEIVSYDRTLSNKTLSKDVVRSKRIDITQNDVYMSPIRIVLNFTNKDITLSDDSEFRKTFSRLEQDKFEEYSGKVLIFTVYTLNTPTHIYDTTGNGNYFEPIINTLSNKNNPKLIDTVKAYKFANDNWFRFNKRDNGLIANSIKVISLQVIPEEEFAKEPVWLENLGWVVSNETIFNLQDNPAAIIGNTGIKDIREIFPNNSFMCYLVDNEDFIGDRYINVAGHVKRINKIKNRSMPNGLYFADKGSSDPTGEMFCKLEDIDKNEYVYKSIEEANNGANLRKRYTDEIETAKTQLEAIRIEASADLIRVKAEHEIEIARLKAELEREKAVTERERAQVDREKSKAEIESIDRKREFETVKNNNEIVKNNIDVERDAAKLISDVFKHELDKRSLGNKYQYETEKYRRDTTVETLKTLAAVAGLVSTGILIWNKIK